MIESPVEHTLERTKGLVTERQVERSETTETLLNAAKEDADLVVVAEPPTIESVEAALMLAGTVWSRQGSRRHRSTTG